MRRVHLIGLNVVLVLAQSAVAPALAQPLQSAPEVRPAITQWRSGLSEINEDWAARDGDNLAWAQPGFDDSHWSRVDLEDMGAATAGWSWYRKRVTLAPDRSRTRLMIEGGDGTYELYVNGVRMEGAELHSAFDVRRPTERVFSLPDEQDTYVLALRTHTPAHYAALRLPLFLSVTLGGPTAIEYERQALEAQRLYPVLPSMALNLALCLAGIGAFGLFAWQRAHREYLFLGLFLLLSALSDGLVRCQQMGVVPTSVGMLFADPLTYFFSIAQIEFTFAFAGRRVGRAWRAYEALLLCPLVLVVLVWSGQFPFAPYELTEALFTVPVAMALPVLLFAWWRRGNHEAALLILPSMLPAATGIAAALGSASIYLHWERLEFLADDIPVGPVAIALFDIGTFLFLLAIGVVMFNRFTKVSREQARAVAELEAAREIQRRLVPAQLPVLQGWKIEAAYLPANEVGGDFYQVLGEARGPAWVVVGDVSGKGLRAAMTGTLAIGALRALAPEGSGPAELLSRLNDRLAESADGGFITCLCARLTPDGLLTLANAGHLPPYRNGVELEMDTALPLGIVPRLTYTESQFQLEEGDILTLLSDGVVEAQNRAGELFGFERTREMVRGTAGALAVAARDFGQTDDITVLSLLRRKVPEEQAAGAVPMYGTGSRN